MTTAELPEFGGLCAVRLVRPDRTGGIRGRWTLAGTAGAAELRGRRPRRFARRRAGIRSLPLVAGELTVADPLYGSVGEILVALDKTRSVRLTVSDLTALGNRRIAIDVVASALGSDAGADETLRFEGGVEHLPQEQALRVTLNGYAPSALGGPGTRLSLTALFHRG